MNAIKQAGGTSVRFLNRVASYVRMHGLGYTMYRAGEMARTHLFHTDDRVYRRERPDEQELARQRSCPPCETLISIVIPAYNTKPAFLEELGDSLLRQTYPHWEACLYDGCSPQEETHAALRALAARDPRFRVVFGERNEGISGNTNEAIRMAHGAYIAFCDHDDTLSPEAMWQVARVIADENPDVIYSDEDKLSSDGGYHTDPHRKPDYCPDNLRSGNYICHLSVIRRTLLERVGGLRPDYDGSQDHDLMLRVCEQAERIVHIPRVLYHWRTFLQSMSHERLSVCLDAASRATMDSMRRIGFPGTCSIENGLLRLCYEVGDFTVDTLRFHTVQDMNRLAAASTAEMLLFLLDDTPAPDAEGLRELEMYAQRPDVCAVTPLLQDRRGRTLHAGYIIAPNGTVSSRNRKLPALSGGWHGMNRTSVNVCAVSPVCFLVRRKAFQPLDESLPLAESMAAWCIHRMKEQLYHVCTPHCMLTVSDNRLFSPFRVTVPENWHDPCRTGARLPSTRR